MIVSDDQQELGTIDLDGIVAIIITSRGASISTPFLTEMAVRNIPVMLCNDRYQPVSIAQPLIQHSDQNRRFEAQAKMKTGLRNKIWQRLVIGKVRNQHALLKSLDSASSARLKRLAGMVRTGDPDNIEAQAARVYWQALFFDEFRRDREADGINALLNYGYAVIRSTMTNAILASGLHPTFGIHHKNRNNPLCLVDDLMEPYRPIVDQLVQRLYEKNQTNLTVEVKQCLASIVTVDQPNVGTLSPLFKHMSNLSYALWEAMESEKLNLPMPSLMSDLELEATAAKC